ncbi:hypothetical protein BC941DRAFT_265979 [Chlamydoabsidia padenii]|nr:hypothetical protein BC941DRAFT_265979 [Chlamydoabsidia padenii]
MDSELLRRETGDIHASFAMLQVSHNELLQQFSALQENYATLLEGFEEMKKTQLQQQIILRRLFESSTGQQVSPSVLVTQWQSSSLCPPTPEINYLPPSPSPSDQFNHSRHSSFNSAETLLQTRQTSFATSSSNTLGFSN